MELTIGCLIFALLLLARKNRQMAKDINDLRNSLAEAEAAAAAAKQRAQALADSVNLEQEVARVDGLKTQFDAIAPVADAPVPTV